MATLTWQTLHCSSWRLLVPDRPIEERRPSPRVGCLVENGGADSLGTFLDDVSVVVVPEPAGLILLTGGLVLALRRRTI